MHVVIPIELRLSPLAAARLRRGLTGDDYDVLDALEKCIGALLGDLGQDAVELGVPPEPELTAALDASTAGLTEAELDKALEGFVKISATAARDCVLEAAAGFYR